jgi:beta-glucosidase
MADAGAIPSAGGGGVVAYPYLFGYRHFDAAGVAPLFPFGYGLSYTSYSYNSLSLGCGSTTKNGVVRATVEVSNTGTVAGTEVVQVYVGFPSGPDSALQRPVKEYKVAVRVDLDAGATKRVTIPLPVKDWAYFDSGLNDWAVESGEHTIMVGPNSRDIPANMIATVSVQ